MSEYDLADQHLANAAELCERIGLLSWLAQTRCNWAQMLTRRGRPDDQVRAAALARQSLAAADQIGMSGVAREAQQLLTEIEIGELAI